MHDLSTTMPMRAWLAAGAFAAIGTIATPAQARDLSPSADAPAITRRHTGIDDSGIFEREMQACRSGTSQQGRQACMDDARNARAARRHGKLQLHDPDYMANALARCRPFAGEDRAACEARVLGFGSTSGSVAGGGLLRQVETVTLPPGEEQLTFAPTTGETVVVIPRQGR